MSLFKLNSVVLTLLICWSAVCSGIYHTVTLQDWENYKMEFNKTYPPGSTPGEAYARYYFNYNVGMIRNHNAYADRGQRTYRLKENQFTDMRLITFNAMFPTVQQPAISNDVMIPPLQDAPLSFNPITMFGQVVAVQNQGIACNSGWAYAAAKAIELMAAVQTGNLSPAELSAQNLIDCAGRSTACKSQVPQAAFDFLTQYSQDLHTINDYPNDLNATEANMCLIPPMAAMMVVNLRSYGRIKLNDDVTLMKAVGAGYPVVVEFNPTSFDFMHYSSGIFQVASTSTVQGAHHLIVLGYDTDAATGLDYWLCLNSFDTTWGEGGFIRIARDSTRTIFRNAIFPLELA